MPSRRPDPRAWWSRWRRRHRASPGPLPTRPESTGGCCPVPIPSPGSGGFLERGGATGREVALARTLTNQAGYLWEQGRAGRALATVQQAIQLLRQLPAGSPPEQQSALPLALHNLGMILSGLGREDEGLAAIGEAVEIWRRLAQASPAEYEPEPRPVAHQLQHAACPTPNGTTRRWPPLRKPWRSAGGWPGPTRPFTSPGSPPH